MLHKNKTSKRGPPVSGPGLLLSADRSQPSERWRGTIQVMLFDRVSGSKLRQFYYFAVDNYRAQEERTQRVGDSIATPASAAELDGLSQQMAVEARARDRMLNARQEFLAYLQKYPMP